MCVQTPLTSPRVLAGWLWRRPEASTCHLEQTGPSVLLLTTLSPLCCHPLGLGTTVIPPGGQATLPGSHSRPQSRPRCPKLWGTLRGSPCSVDEGRGASPMGAVAACTPCRLGSFPGFGVPSWTLSKSPSRGWGSEPSVRPKPTGAPAPASPLQGVLTVPAPNLLPPRSGGA